MSVRRAIETYMGVVYLAGVQTKGLSLICPLVVGLALRMMDVTFVASLGIAAVVFAAVGWCEILFGLSRIYRDFSPYLLYGGRLEGFSPRMVQLSYLALAIVFGAVVAACGYGLGVLAEE